MHPIFKVFITAFDFCQLVFAKSLHHTYFIGFLGYVITFDQARITAHYPCHMPAYRV